MESPPLVLSPCLEDYHYIQNNDMTCVLVSAYTIGSMKRTVHDNALSPFSVPVGYSGFQDYYPHGSPGYHAEVPRNYDAYTAGLSEEEQLERAIRASLWDRGRSRPSLPPQHASRGEGPGKGLSAAN